MQEQLQGQEQQQEQGQGQEQQQGQPLLQEINSSDSTRDPPGAERARLKSGAIRLFKSLWSGFEGGEVAAIAQQ